MELHHRAEIGRLSFLVWTDCILVAIIRIPMNTWPLIADLLVSCCIDYIFTLYGSLLRDQISVLMPERTAPVGGVE